MIRKLSRKELILTVASSLLLACCIALIVVTSLTLVHDHPVELTGRMEIRDGAEFSKELTNSSSPQFKSLAFDVQNLISDAYSHSELWRLFRSSEVLSFRLKYPNGPVEVRFDLWFNQPVNVQEAEEQLRQGVIEVGNTDLVIEIYSIEITEKNYQTTVAPTTTPIRCLSTEMRCADGSMCLNRHYFCDGHDQCPDGSDEDAATCGTKCDGQFDLRAPSGSFSSSETSTNFTDGTHCRWLIMVDPGLSIEIKVQFKSVDGAFMSFYEGIQTNKPPTAKISASPSSTWTVWLLSNETTVLFQAYGPTEFSATYRAANTSELTDEQKLTCNFEQDMCFWRNMDDNDEDFVLRRGSGPNRPSGPNYDHTFGNSSGYFLSALRHNTYHPLTFRIRSLPLTTTEEPMCLSFWYHMYGVDVHSLTVLLVRSNPYIATKLFKKEGNYGNIWNYGQRTLNLTSEDKGREVRVMFQALKYRGRWDIIALDDILLTPGPCGPDPPEPTNVPVTTTPQTATTAQATTEPQATTQPQATTKPQTTPPAQ